MTTKCMLGLLVGLAWCAASCLVVSVSVEMCLGKPYPSGQCSRCCENDGNVAVPLPLPFDANTCTCLDPMKAASYARDYRVELVETKDEMKACDHLAADGADEDKDEGGGGPECEICCGWRLMKPKKNIFKKCKCYKDWKIKRRWDGSTYIGGTGLSGALGCGPGGASLAGGLAAGVF